MIPATAWALLSVLNGHMSVAEIGLTREVCISHAARGGNCCEYLPGLPGYTLFLRTIAPTVFTNLSTISTGRTARLWAARSRMAFRGGAA
jgi:hypothetical protein